MAALPATANALRLPLPHHPAAAQNGNRKSRTSCVSTSRVCSPQASTSGRSHTRICSAFDFASLEKTPRRVYSRVHGKQEAKRTLLLVRRLTSLTDKQFLDLAPHLAADLLKEVKIARGIPSANQGRKRQENLCAKVLRDLDEAGLRQAEELVQLAETSSGQLRVDSEVRHLAATWQDALLAGDKEVEKEIFGYPRDWGLDGSRLRQLVRQYQQLQQQVAAAEEEQQQQLAAMLVGDADATEGLSAMGRPALRRSQGAGGSKGGEQQVQRLRTKLREAEGEVQALLEPLAVRALRQPTAIREPDVGDE